MLIQGFVSMLRVSLSRYFVSKFLVIIWQIMFLVAFSIFFRIHESQFYNAKFLVYCSLIELYFPKFYDNPRFRFNASGFFISRFRFKLFSYNLTNYSILFVWMFVTINNSFPIIFYHAIFHNVSLLLLS